MLVTIRLSETLQHESSFVNFLGYLIQLRLQSKMKFFKLHRFANLEIFIAANNVKVDCEGEFKINKNNILRFKEKLHVP